MEQQKEYIVDRVKVASSQRATFDLLSEKVKLLERWQAEGNSVGELATFRAHHNKLGKALGYDEEFIKKSTAQENVSSALNAEELKRVSTSASAATKDLAAPEAKLSQKWNERLMSSAAKFKTEFPGSEWAKKHPMGALTATLALSEAVTGALRADYTPDGKHSAIPTLISFMSQDVATWGQFSTKDAGIVVSVAAEATQKGFDAATVMGGAYLLEKAVSSTAGRTAAGQAVASRMSGALASRVLGIAGIAYHGYSTFADGSFTNMNNLQLTGAVTGPIAAGGAVGFIIAGPIGGGVGAGVPGAAGGAGGRPSGGLTPASDHSTSTGPILLPLASYAKAARDCFASGFRTKSAGTICKWAASPKVTALLSGLTSGAEGFQSGFPMQ